MKIRFIVTLLAAFFAMCGIAQAHTGHINASQTCTGWSVEVVLDNNTTSDRSVDVITTGVIKPGFTGHHYNTSFGTIFTDSGASNGSAQGTVKLVISAGTQQEYVAGPVSLPQAEGCVKRVTPVAPVIHKAIGCGTSTSVTIPQQPQGIDVSVVKANGREVVDFTAQQGYAITAGSKTHYSIILVTRAPCPEPLVSKPSASFVGPCGDPFYGARFNNSRSTRAVTFIWRYISYHTGALASVRVKVAAGQKVRVPFRHVLGNTSMTIKTANGRVLAAGVSAAPGNYPVCHF